MVAPLRVVIRNGRMDGAGRCVVCQEDVPAGSGFTARSGDQVFRFKCADCLDRFEADPAAYLTADQQPAGDHCAEESPASEWACY